MVQSPRLVPGFNEMFCLKTGSGWQGPTMESCAAFEIEANDKRLIKSNFMQWLLPREPFWMQETLYLETEKNFGFGDFFGIQKIPGEEEKIQKN